MAAGLGAHLELPASAARPDRLLFAEGGARLLVSVPPFHTVAWQQLLEAAAAAGSPVPAQCLGVVEAGDRLTVVRADTLLLDCPVADLRHAFEAGIPRRLSQVGPPPDH